MTERTATRDDEASWEAPVRELEAIARDRTWDDAAMKQIRAGLRHAHELVRVEAAETAEARRVVATLPRLRQLLTDPSPLVRSAVATAIGAMGTARDIGRLAQRFAAERSPRARVGLAAGLWLLGDARGSDALIRLLGSKQYRVRCAVANTLAFYEDRLQESERALPALRQALTADETVAGREALQRAIATLARKNRKRG